jgi:hypothetical protein
MVHIAQRAENHRMLLTYDPRTEAEKMTAYKILQIARPDHLINGIIHSIIKFFNSYLIRKYLS